MWNSIEGEKDGKTGETNETIGDHKSALSGVSCRERSPPTSESQRPESTEDGSGKRGSPGRKQCSASNPLGRIGFV